MLPTYSALDEIRIKDGAKKLKSHFASVFKENPKQAAELLNDTNVTFLTLYLLKDEIPEESNQRELSIRIQSALSFIKQVINHTGYGKKGKSLLPSKGVLKWILETGSAEELSDSIYKEVMDVTVSLLLNQYKDDSVLPLVVELIFTRNKQDGLIHDLVWALFRLKNPKALLLIAEKLRSENKKDKELARELLNISTETTTVKHLSDEDLHRVYITWLNENKPYLYFTDQSYQESTKPSFCALDYERKYLQQGTASYERIPLSFINKEEKNIAAFKQLSPSEQKKLANYSNRLHKENPAAWNSWLRLPVDQQLEKISDNKEEDFI